MELVEGMGEQIRDLHGLLKNSICDPLPSLNTSLTSLLASSSRLALSNPTAVGISAYRPWKHVHEGFYDVFLSQHSSHHATFNQFGSSPHEPGQPVGYYGSPPIHPSFSRLSVPPHNTNSIPTPPLLPQIQPYENGPIGCSEVTTPSRKGRLGGGANVTRIQNNLLAEEGIIVSGTENNGQVSSFFSTTSGESSSLIFPMEDISFRSPQQLQLNQQQQATSLQPPFLPHDEPPEKSGKKKRKRCADCMGCQRKVNCGDCAPCRNDKSHQICKMRRCDKLTKRWGNYISKRGKENLKAIKKKDLVKLINNYLTDITVCYDEFEDNKKLCKSLNDRNAMISLKCQQLKRQITNFKSVVKIYESEEQACRREKKFVAPKHVKRSVGLQLNSDHFDLELSNGIASNLILPSISILDSLTKCTVRSFTEVNSSSKFSTNENNSECRQTLSSDDYNFKPFVYKDLVDNSNCCIRVKEEKTVFSDDISLIKAYNGFAVPPPYPEIASDVGELETTNSILTPSQPHVKVKFGSEGKCIVVSWNVTLSQYSEAISHYDVYGYKETQFLKEYKWKLIGIIKALPLPMAIKLGELQRGYHYYFCIRAVDIQNRSSKFSDVKGIKFDLLDIS